MSESTSWAPGVAAVYHEDYYLGVPRVRFVAKEQELGVAAAVYNEDYHGVPGVRFVPTDQELIVDYLGRKLRGEPPHTDVMHDGLDVYGEHPKSLVAKLGESIEGVWYLFSPRKRKYAGGNRPKRSIACDGDGGGAEGHWKALEAETPIFGSGSDGKVLIGTKRQLTFYEDTYEVDSQGKRSRAKGKRKPTKWKMWEYVFSNSSMAAGNNTAPDPMLLNDCVLCMIRNKSRRVDSGPGTMAQGEEESEGDEEEPRTSDGGGEPHQKHLPQQQRARGGGDGTQAGQQHQGPSADAGAGAASSHGNQQPASAEAPLPDDGCDLGTQSLVDVDVLLLEWFDDDCSIPRIFGDQIGMGYVGREALDAQTSGQQQASR